MEARDLCASSLPQPYVGGEFWEGELGEARGSFSAFGDVSLALTKVTWERPSLLDPSSSLWQPGSQGKVRREVRAAQGCPFEVGSGPMDAATAEGPAALPWAAAWKTRAQPSCLGPAASNYALHKALDVKSAAEAGRWRRWKGTTSKVSGRGEGNAISVLKLHAYSNLLCDCVTNLEGEKNQIIRRKASHKVPQEYTTEEEFLNRRVMCYWI